jgi:TDG/mug DNA glycosylase family protein
MKAGHSQGFAPIARADARVLILGTLPGQVSLAKQQYYGQRHNTFWRIMGELFGFDAALPYEARTLRLEQEHVALWDVCAAAHRPGSLDSAIDTRSMQPNDFAAFLPAHPALRFIAFNGAKAAELFERKVLPGFPAAAKIASMRLPSTSPAHAAMPYAEKVRLWEAVRNHARTRHGSTQEYLALIRRDHPDSA